MNFISAKPSSGPWEFRRYNIKSALTEQNMPNLLNGGLWGVKGLEPVIGIEPMTNGLQNPGVASGRCFTCHYVAKFRLGCLSWGGVQSKKSTLFPPAPALGVQRRFVKRLRRRRLASWPRQFHCLHHRRHCLDPRQVTERFLLHGLNFAKPTLSVEEVGYGDRQHG